MTTKLTSSSLGAFRDCPRKYFYLYVAKRVKLSEAPALSFGKAVHVALEQIWRGNPDWMKVARPAVASLFPQDAAKITAMLKGYKPPIDQYEVLDTEKQFEVRIINPDTQRPMIDYIFTGKLDALVRRKKDGLLWVLEHKTTVDEIIGYGTYWQRLAVDHQVAYYVLATQAAGCIYDVLRKPQLKLCKTDEAAAAKAGIPAADYYLNRLLAAIQEEPETYYQVRDIVKTDDDIAEAKADLWDQAHMLSECASKSRWPRNSGACRSFFGVCPYLGVCTGQARIDDPAEFRDKAAANEELTEKAA